MEHSIIIAKGLPGSGKTAWSKDWAASSTQRVRIAVEDIANMLCIDVKHNVCKNIVGTAIANAVDANLDIVVDAYEFEDLPDIANWKLEHRLDYQVLHADFITKRDICILASHAIDTEVDRIKSLAKLHNDFLTNTDRPAYCQVFELIQTDIHFALLESRTNRHKLLYSKFIATEYCHRSKAFARFA